MMYFVEDLPARKITLERLDRVIEFAWEFLKIRDDVVIEIEFVRDMDSHQFGDADVEDGVGQITINRNIAKSELVPTIFHEMVHIKQILSNDLVIGEGKRPSEWRGMQYSDNYENLPWEQEAFRLEQHMMKIFEEK